MVPIYATSTYGQQSPGVHKGFEYARSQNPTRFAFERAVADLESGTAGFAFASGLAAIATVFELLDSGAHVVATDDIYGGTFRLLERVRKRSANLQVSFVDFTDLAAVEAAIRPETKMLWVETPTNPLLRIVDLEGVAALARRKGLISVADNTFCSPYIQRPLELGIDLVVHSTTKYLNGHSDMVGGCVAVGDNKDLVDRLKFLQNAVGSISGPFDSFLALRGLKTLALRMERHSTTASSIAEWLESAQRRQARHLSRPRQPSAARPRQGADAGVRRHDHGRARPRPRRHQEIPGAHAIVHAGRKPRRRRKPDRASGADDAWLDPGREARRNRHFGFAGAALGRHRGRRRSDRRPRPGAGGLIASMAPDGRPPAIAAYGIDKSFAATRALDGADLVVARGEIVALMGANGAGKSTLVKILSGTLQPDAGRVEIAGKAVSIPSPQAAHALGVATVHQQTNQAGAPGLTVAENLMLDELCSGASPVFLTPRVDPPAGGGDRRGARPRPAARPRLHRTCARPSAN